jgi:hypothetical protein
MPFDTSSRLLGTPIGEKVAVLSEFITNDLDARATRGTDTAAPCYLLIARSPDSPVAQALHAHATDIAAAGIRVRAIFTEIEGGRAAAATLAPPFAQPSECRLASDPRLLAAHEQLVLAPDCAWIGDCMRREPTKRDAYERFARNCPETAATAARSFERMWRIATSAETFPHVPAALASRTAGLNGTTIARSESFRRQ